MEIVRIILLCVAASLVAVLLRKEQPGMGAMVAMAAGIAALMMSLPALGRIVAAFGSLSRRAGLMDGSAALMLRACGISLICEFGAGLCLDAGEGTLAQRIDFGGRIVLLSMSVPLLTQLLEGMLGWLP